MDKGVNIAVSVYDKKERDDKKDCEYPELPTFREAFFKHLRYKIKHSINIKTKLSIRKNKVKKEGKLVMETIITPLIELEDIKTIDFTDV